jgi:hypothetical protein
MPVALTFFSGQGEEPVLNKVGRRMSRRRVTGVHRRHLGP